MSLTHRIIQGPRRVVLAACTLFVVAACDTTTPPPVTTVPTGPITFVKNPCTGPDTLSMTLAQSTLVDCSNGGTTLTLAGNGASYVIVPQFPTDLVDDLPAIYSLASGDLPTGSVSLRRVSPRLVTGGGTPGVLPARQNWTLQRRFTGALHSPAHLRQIAASRAASAAISGPSFAVSPPPPLGSTRSFHVASSASTNAFKTVTASLQYVGSNILLYIDTSAPTGGFTSTQLTDFGQYFDQTLYAIDSTAFGQPSDVDQNGHVIMLMSPVVNGITPTAQCESEGFVAGFFEPEDFGGASDPASNQGEIFYSIVPDPNGTFSCPHTVDDVGSSLPATFVHELQHLINYSQHVIVHGGEAESSWLDEGLSIIAEELGSLYYEQRCPAPACRTDPSQIFPDSAEGFVGDFLYDSYQYALLPDTASLTLHVDSDDGFAWRGGDWLLMRWLGDQFGSSLFRKFETGPADGLTNIQTETGQSFTSLFASFGLSLYTDSLPGLPRTTAPAIDRFASRNVRQLWARLYATSGPASDIPTSVPLILFPISTDTSAAVLNPGTMSFYRLDTPASSAAVTIRFSGQTGTPLAGILHPQLAVFRLPPGQ
jgi:hypothetical protein